MQWIEVCLDTPAEEIDALPSAGKFQQSVHALAWLLSKQA